MWGKLLIANLDIEPLTVRVNLLVNTVNLTTLDAIHLEDALHEPESFRGLPGLSMHGEAGVFSVMLDSYGLARLDFVDGK